MGEPSLQTARDWLEQTLKRARRPDKEAMESLRMRAPFWWVFVFLFTFSTYQIIMNPFGFSDLVQRYTQDISDLLISGPYLYPDTGHDQISVALVDDRTLGELQMPWPWSYGAQARTLDALLAERPRAVVVDILFVDPRKDDTLPELVDEIGRYKRAGVPLYFSGDPSVAPGQPPIRQKLLDAGAHVVDPTLLPQGIVRQYNVDGRCMNGEAAATPCKSLALTVYSDLFPKAPLDVNSDGLVELMWGTRSDPYNTKWMGLTESCDQDIGFFRRVYLAFFDPSQVRSRCPYESVIPVEKLLQGTDDSDIAKLAKGRIVFYGGALQGVQDRSFSPVNGLIANVFIHAMALDNLITFKGRPEQNVMTVGGTTLNNNTIQVFAIVPVILILAWLHIRNLRARGTERETEPRESGALFELLLEKVMESAWHWGALALALGAGLALTLAAGISVANWVEVIFVSAELAAMLMVGVPDAIWGYLHHVAGGIAVPAKAHREHSA